MRAARSSESFRSLLLRHRGRTGLSQRDLATRAGVSLRSLQDWEAGVTLPGGERLRRLLQALCAAGAITPGRELVEARALWTAVEQETQRRHAPFDEQWFLDLLHQLSSRSTPHGNDSAPAAGANERAHDWGEAPDTSGFVGRVEELGLLQEWVVHERSRVVALLGMGGIGKTSLAASLGQTVAPNFERAYWRSLRNAPPIAEWLAGAIGFLSDQRIVPPPSESERITTLLELLRSRRCLLLLDNLETLLEPAQPASMYRAGMDGYGRLLQAIGETSHQSCLLFTSREAPPELAVLSGGARALELHGLAVAEARALLSDKQLSGETPAWVTLVDRYGGNGLALKIVSETIRQLFAGDVTAFVSDEVTGSSSVFGGIRRLLDGQAERLSTMERDILRRLAIEREPITLAELSSQIAPRSSRSMVIEAVENLRRRSLVDRGERGASFTLQSMVLEYITDRLVETIADEIERGQPDVLTELPIIKAESKEYVRQAQERLIGAPILQRLHAGEVDRLLGLLDAWRGRPINEHGYGPGNVVNLLRLRRGDLRGLDLSRLELRQVYLQGTDAQAASLAGAHVSGAMFGQAFDYPTAVALSSDGTYLMAGTTTGEVRLWWAADCTLLLATKVHTGAVWGLALAHDGRLVASGGGDGTVRVWEAPTGRLIGGWQAHPGEVRSVALSGDGQFMASAGVDGTLKLWEAATGRLMSTLRGHTGAVWGVAISSDGRRIVSGGGDGTVRLWEPRSGQLLATLRGHAGLAYFVALSADGRLLASGGGDGIVRLWDAEHAQELSALQGHTGAVYGVAISEDGRLVASGGGDATVRLWDTASGRPIATLEGHNGLIYDVALSGDGRLLASCGGDTVRLWEPELGHQLATLQGQTSMIYGLALSRDGRRLASGGVDGIIRLWDVEAGEPLAMLHSHTGLVLALAFSGDRKLLASGGIDARLRVWDAESGQQTEELQGHTGLIYGVAFSRDGQLVASGAVDGTVRLWEAASGRLLAIFEGHSGGVRGVAFSNDGQLLASGDGDGTVRLWETGTHQLLLSQHGHTGAAYSVALSEDGRLIVSGGGDGNMQVWDVSSGEHLGVLHAHTGGIRSVAVSADGRTVVGGGLDGTIRVWLTETRQLLSTLNGHTSLIYGVGLSENGQLLASGGVDGMVRLWDMRSGDCLRTLRSDRCYERLDITGLTGVTDAQRAALFALGAIDHS
ncbi:MAG: helix-turn-helix domain-containing protein [Chloroflexi bacterium]|nr:helix-turn-helix domain-containing protein [Chloroflexota bacterium]